MAGSTESRRIRHIIAFQARATGELEIRRGEDQIMSRIVVMNEGMRPSLLVLRGGELVLRRTNGARRPKRGTSVEETTASMCGKSA